MSERSFGKMFGAKPVSTFMGLPECKALDQLDNFENLTSVILGVPCATPYVSVGAYCAEAPAAIRDAAAEYSANLLHHDFDTGGGIFPENRISSVDCGNLAYVEADGAGNRAAIKSAVKTILKSGASPILIGGDDSIPIPMLLGMEDLGEVHILQIDAHIDWRDDVMGEPLGLSSTMRRASEMPHVKSIVQVGQRSIGSARPEDVSDALNWGVSFVSGREVALSNGIQRAIDLIPAGSSVAIALDVDAMDPAIMPAVIGRAPGGLSYWQILQLIEGVAAKARIAAFDIVEFMPERDIDGQGALVAARIISNVIGHLARQ